MAWCPLEHSHTLTLTHSMTKTQRRRAAHQRAINAFVPSAGMPQDYDAAVRLLTDKDQWRRLEDALYRVLTIEFTSPFIDTEAWCSEHAHLVVQLDLLRDPGTVDGTELGLNPYELSVPDLQRRAAQALDAIATLCTTAQHLSRDDDMYSRFWQRVIDSAMLESTVDASAVDSWTRFTKARGIPLLMSWSRKEFETSQLFEALRDFLATQRPTGCETVAMPITFGLRFVRALLPPTVLSSLHELLVMPSEDAEMLLVDPTCLQSLWFEFDELNTAELGVIAAMLADPKLRRVDALTMENVDIEQLVEMEPGFADTLNRFFTSIFTSRNGDQDGSLAPPLSLSLPYTSLDAERIDMLRQAITTGSRPLGALSLPSLRVQTAGGFRSLASLLFTTLPNVAPGATLDLSTLDNRFIAGLGLLARDTIEGFWSTGEIREGRVECVFNGPLSHRPHGKMMDAPMPPSVFYKIEDYHASTRFVKIAVSTTSASGEVASVSGWIPSTAVTQLRCDGVDVIRSNFSRLRFDPTHNDHISSRVILYLTSAIGSQLKSLALRGYSSVEGRLSATASSIPEILMRCPQLEELLLEGSLLTMGSSMPFWADPACALPRSLSILSLGRCGLRDLSLDGLHTLPLRYLSLPGNPIGAAGVTSVLSLLQTHPSLAFVELAPQASDPPAVCVELRSQIDALLDHDFLHARDKAVVLSVLFDIQRRNPRLPYPGNEVVASVFAFAGTHPRRVVKWSQENDCGMIVMS